VIFAQYTPVGYTVFYYDKDHLKTIEGFGDKEQDCLNKEGIYTVSDLADLIETDIEKAQSMLRGMLAANTFYQHSQGTEAASMIVDTWVFEAQTIRKGKSKYMILQDLF